MTRGVHALGYNCARSEPIWMKFGALWVHCLPLAWQILDAIRAEARATERAEIFVLFFVKETTRDFADFRSAKFHEICTQHVDLRDGESLRNKIFKMLPQGVFFPKRQLFARKSSRDFRLQAAIFPKWLQIAENHDRLPAYGMSTFHCYRWNQLEVIPLACTARTRRAPCPKNTLLQRPCSPIETTWHYKFIPVAAPPWPLTQRYC